MIDSSFFDRDAAEVARDLLGKAICRFVDNEWRYARIIETEAYYIHEKGSHASLGYTHKRRALFMPAGTIYMYYSRAGDSLNISCHGEGNAVLLKSAVAHLDNPLAILEKMAADNPIVNIKTGAERPRPFEFLCSGQALLCRSMRLYVKDWDGKTFDKNSFFIKDIGYKPASIAVAPRLGISPGRDEYLPLRFLDPLFARFSTLRRV